MFSTEGLQTRSGLSIFLKMTDTVPETVVLGATSVGFWYYLPHVPGRKGPPSCFLSECLHLYCQEVYTKTLTSSSYY